MGVQVNSYFKSKYTGAQIENMLDAFGNTAAAYETSTAYSVGDLVLYNNALYVCTGATTGAFDPSKWQQTTLAELVENLGATYTDPNSGGNVVIGVDSTVGEKILRSLTFPGLTNRYYLPFAQYIRERLANDPSTASFGIEIPDAEEAPMHSVVIKGKTVAANQLVRPLESTYWEALSGDAPTFNNGECAFTASAANIGAQIKSQYRNSVVNGHTYYYSFSAKASAATSMRARYVGGLVDSTLSATSSWQTNEGIIDATTSGTGGGYVVATEASGATCTFKDYQFIDLNNSPVANRLAEIGTDVAKLKQVWLEEKGTPFPQYMPYDAGSLANVDGTYQLHGKNLYDIDSAEQGGIDANTGAVIPANSRVRSDYMPVKPSTVYRYKTNNALYLVYIVYHYDANKNFIRSATQNSANSTTTTPDNAAYTRIVIRKSDNNDFTKDAVQNMYFAEGSNDAPSEPYYNGGTIDCSTAPLNGVGTAQDEEDFATGTRTTRFAQYTFDGTENWEYVSSWTHHGFRLAGADFTAIIPNGKNGGALFMLGAPYTNIGSVSSWSTIAANDKQVGTANSIGGITISDDAYSDAASFKAAMVGKTLVYELAAPVVSSETPQPLETQYGYNVLEPVSGGVQSAEVDTTYYENIAGYIDKKLAEG